MPYGMTSFDLDKFWYLDRTCLAVIQSHILPPQLDTRGVFPAMHAFSRITSPKNKTPPVCVSHLPPYPELVAGGGFMFSLGSMEGQRGHFSPELVPVGRCHRGSSFFPNFVMNRTRGLE